MAPASEVSAAVEKTCHQHHNCLRRHAEQEMGPTVPEPVRPQLSVPEMPRTQIIERTRHRYEDTPCLVAKGWTISAIARRLNLDRKTVRRFHDTDLDELLVSARDRRPNGALEPFEAYLNARFAETQGQVSGIRCSTRSTSGGTGAAAKSFANTSPFYGRALLNRSGPTSPALA